MDRDDTLTFQTYSDDWYIPTGLFVTSLNDTFDVDGTNMRRTIGVEIEARRNRHDATELVKIMMAREQVTTLRDALTEILAAYDQHYVHGPFIQCSECGRRFDLSDPAAAGEWAFGHDCEMG